MYKKNKFPFREYDNDALLDEFRKLQNYRPKYPEGGKLSKNNVGYKCSNKFFQEERMNTPTWNHDTNIEFWKKNKQKIKKYHRRSPSKDLFGTIQFMNHPPSQFPPNIAIELYSYFGAKKVFDPFAGWGDRCIAAMARGLDYTGVDSNKALKEPYEKMIEFFPKTRPGQKIKFINEPVEDVIIDIKQKVGIFDFVLTSPPFWTEQNELIDHYRNQTVTDFEQFMQNVLIPTIQKCKEIAKVSVFYIPDNMAQYLWTYNCKYDDIIEYSGVGNKKYQTYKFFIYKKKSKKRMTKGLSPQREFNL